VKTFLIQALIGGIICALASAAFAPLYDNNPAEMAVAGFFVGAVTQVLLVLLFMRAGWWR
jgi:Na+-driven multidrug efflux pump